MSDATATQENKLNLAVNDAMGQASNIYRQRMAALMGQGQGHSLDSKRPQIWCEFGYPSSLGIADFMNLYRRGGVAYGAVNRFIETCWGTVPEVIEGEPSDDDENVTPWEQAFKKIVNDRVWSVFAEADKRRMVCRYSAILIQLKDNKKWSEPITSKKAAVQAFLPVWAGSIAPVEFYTDEKAPNYGKPKLWRITESPSSANGAATVGRQIDVHPDRVFILGDYTNEAIGFFDPVYNNFVNLEKVEGGSGESFLKNAARQLSLNFDKEINLANIAATYGVPLSELKEKFQETARELNRGNDMAIITQGATATSLVDAISDPSMTYDINVRSISCGINMPSKMLIGNQTGERASTEDQKSFNRTCMSRRGRLGFDIQDFVGHLQRFEIIPPMEVFSVVWDDLNELNQSERLDAADKMAKINASSMGTGEQVFEVTEIRVAAGFEPTDPIKLPETEPDDEEDAPPAKAGTKPAAVPPAKKAA